MVDVTYEQAKAIVDLAKNIKNNLTLEHLLVGIPTDGIPLIKGIAYVFKYDKINCKKINCSFLAASSKYNFIDKHRLNELKELNHPVIFIDWQTVTGKLSKMLKKNYPNCIYAVLSDPNNTADICATTKNIPKFAFPENYKETLRTIGFWIEPNTIDNILKLKSSGGKMKYIKAPTEKSIDFYTTLYEKIAEVLAEK